MDPITLIVTALAAGAAAGLKPTAEQVVKDAYQNLKTLVKRKYAAAAPTVDYLEARPDRESVHQVLQEDLAATTAAQDTELLTLALAVLKAVAEKAPELAVMAGVSLKDIRVGASLNIKDIVVQSDGSGSTYGFKGKNIETTGDFTIDSVTVTSGQAKPASQPAAPVTRYTDLRCPGQVSLGREFQVTVRLTLRPHAESRDAQELSLLTRQPVVVEVDAPDFVLTEGNTRSIDVSQERDSDWAVFGLKPTRSGRAEVRLRFLQNGNLLGQARCDVLVMEQPVAVQTQQLPALPLAFGVGATPPKRILCISLRGEHLHYSLYADGAPVDLALPTVDLRTDPVRWMRRRYARLSGLAESATGRAISPRTAAEEVRQIGELLWTDLIPPSLKSLWWEERAAWASEPTLIVSDEAHIPWELVWPNETAADLPWGVHGPVSRWLGVDGMHPVRPGPTERLTLSPWAALFPPDSGVAFVEQEAALLRRLLAAEGERSPASLDRQTVLDLLAGGECRWLYAGTHGRLDPGGEAEGASLLLEGGELLEPEVLVRWEILAGLRRSRPGVFWNICHGAVAGWSLTGVGGWAGRLIDGGASLFLAPQWTVTDRAALGFADIFYSRLTAGDGVALATQQARLAVRELTGDPSWLAYALYAHPCATAGM